MPALGKKEASQETFGLSRALSWQYFYPCSFTGVFFLPIGNVIYCGLFKCDIFPYNICSSTETAVKSKGTLGGKLKKRNKWVDQTKQGKCSSWGKFRELQLGRCSTPSLGCFNGKGLLPPRPLAVLCPSKSFGSRPRCSLYEEHAKGSDLNLKNLAQ